MGGLSNDDGSAVVDFVLVATLAVLVIVSLLQLALGLHARNVLIDAAGEGARRAALVGGTSQEAEERVRTLVDAALSDGYVDSVVVTRVDRGGLTLVEVTVVAPLPLIGLIGPTTGLSVTGHAVDETALVGTPPGPDSGRVGP